MGDKTLMIEMWLGLIINTKLIINTSDYEFDLCVLLASVLQQVFFIVYVRFTGINKMEHILIISKSIIQKQFSFNQYDNYYNK